MRRAPRQRHYLAVASLAVAARQGNRGLLSHNYYLNYHLTAAQYYQVDPMGGDAANLTPKQKARILGGETAMWSEYVGPENINSQIWPYLAAAAERFWSPQEVQDVGSMYQRLAIVSRKLKYYGLNSEADVNELLQRMSGNADPVPLRVLTSVVQTPQGYLRYKLEKNGGSYNTLTPLNRLVDAAPPESETARKFHDIAEQIASGKASPEEWQQARQWLTLWRDNDAQLQPMLVQSFLMKELVPISRDLNQVATIGLQALDDLKSNRAVTAEERQRNLDALKSAEQPRAVLRNMVAPSVELLVQATKTE